MRAYPCTVAVLLACGCLEATPFGVDPSKGDLTSENLEELARREPTLPLRIVAIGDVHNELDDLARTVEAVNRRDGIAFVAVAGDMSDYGLVQELEWVRERLDALDVPYLTAVGNHDVLSSGRQVYRQMFGPFDYHFRYAGFEFVFYNSNTREFPGEPVPDIAWLDERLTAASGAEGIVLVTHQPVGLRVATLLAEHPISLVVHAHLADHRVYELNGTPVLQCGTFEKDRFHTVVTLTRGAVEIQRCLFESCGPAVRFTTAESR